MSIDESLGIATPEIACKQCGGRMEKTVLARENTGMVALALTLAIIGIGLLFVFPIGTIDGVNILIAATKKSDRSKKVWKIEACVYFFKRD